jgi:hypothetical protein
MERKKGGREMLEGVGGGEVGRRKELNTGKMERRGTGSLATIRRQGAKKERDII